MKMSIKLFSTTKLYTKCEPRFLEFSTGVSVIFHPEKSYFIKTSRVGKEILEIIKAKPSTPEEIIKEVSHRYHLPEKEVEKSVISLLEDLINTEFLYFESAPKIPEEVKNYNGVNLSHQKLDELWVKIPFVSKNGVIEKVISFPTNYLILSLDNLALHSNLTYIFAHIKHCSSAKLILLIPEVWENPRVYEYCKYLDGISVFLEESSPNDVGFKKLASFF